MKEKIAIDNPAIRIDLGSPLIRKQNDRRKNSKLKDSVIICEELIRTFGLTKNKTRPKYCTDLFSVNCPIVLNSTTDEVRSTIKFIYR